MNYIEDDPFGDDDDEEAMATPAPVAQRARTNARSGSASVNEKYPEPEPQKQLNNQFGQFFVSAFHKDTRERITESHENIGRAVDRANYLRFREGYYVWVYGGTELSWQGKEVGYQVKPDASN